MRVSRVDARAWACPPHPAAAGSRSHCQRLAIMRAVH